MLRAAFQPAHQHGCRGVLTWRSDLILVARDPSPSAAYPPANPGRNGGSVPSCRCHLREWISVLRVGWDGDSHRRDCHCADALSPSLLKRLLKVEWGAAE